MGLGIYMAVPWSIFRCLGHAKMVKLVKMPMRNRSCRHCFPLVLEILGPLCELLACFLLGSHMNAIYNP